MDLETKSYANSPRPATISRRVDNRIEELTNQLNQSSREKSTLGRSAEKLAKDAKFQQSELERTKVKFEEERKEYEARIQDLRNALDTVVCCEALDLRCLAKCFNSKRRNMNCKQLTAG